MMFLTTGVSGCSHSIDPTLVNIDNIGNIEISNGVCDELYVTAAIEDYDPDNKPVWNNYTKMYAHFNGNLLAGNVGYTLDTLSSVRIKRRPLGTYSWITLHEITNITDISQVNVVFYDRTAMATDYEYALVPVINGIEGEYVIQQIRPQFNGVFVVGLNKIYSTEININSVGEILPQRNFNAKSVVPIDSKYPYVFHNGITNYNSSSLSATWLQFDKENCEWVFMDNWKYRKEFVDMLTDGKPKIIKYEDGRGWLVGVIGDSVTETANGHSDIVVTSFNWEEIGDLSSSNDLYFSGFINCNIEGS